jgi:arabinose-5-phosphate isomerase
MLETKESFSEVTASQIMTPHAKVIHADSLAVDALHLMRRHSISQLIVVEGVRYRGMIHLHDMIREGII